MIWINLILDNILGFVLDILVVCCLIGIFTGNIPLGIVFIMALAIVLWGILSLIQRNKLTQMGTIILIIGLLSFTYTTCMLFLDIDLKTILNIGTIVIP